MIELNEIKKSLAAILDTYRKSGRFTEKFSAEFEKLFNLESLQIGIIGKMKAGKSTLVNALVFGENVLPTGNKPVTVTLTEIGYGEEDLVEVELLTEADIAGLRAEARGGEEMKAKAATDILSQIDRIEGGYQQYVQTEGGKIRIRLEELNDYVAEGGKLSGLAKTVRIVMNNPNLRGVTIIDTPGFNDPVSSRGATTRNALKDCQILLFVHDAIDMYDQEELSMLTGQIEYAGISEMVDILNKIDLAEDYGIAEWPEYLRAFEEKKQAALTRIGSPVVKELLGKSKSFWLSPYMALLGVIRDEEFTKEMKNDYICFQEDFPELREKQDFITYSNLQAVASEINRLARDGSRYLLETPVITLLGQLQSVAAVIRGEIRVQEDRLSLLRTSREAAAAKVKEFDRYISNIESAIKHSGLAVTLATRISDTEKEIQKLRSSHAAAQFTESHYPETELLSTGIRKANLTRYNLFVSETDDKIRNKLNALKNGFRTECENDVNRLVASLVSENIREEDRGMFKNALLSLLGTMVEKIDIVVKTPHLENQLDGGQQQYGLYKTQFEEEYDDARIRELLKPFRNQLDDLVNDYKLSAVDKLNSIRKTVKQSAEFNPAQKEEAIRETQDTIGKLKTEYSGVQEDIEKLETIQKKK
ncbi:MAG: dynamin family protein [Bacteroides sp.]|nr:dynamin family protein [Bacteroides sp.]